MLEAESAVGCGMNEGLPLRRLGCQEGHGQVITLKQRECWNGTADGAAGSQEGLVGEAPGRQPRFPRQSRASQIDRAFRREGPTAGRGGGCRAAWASLLAIAEPTEGAEPGTARPLVAVGAA